MNAKIAELIKTEIENSVKTKVFVDKIAGVVRSQVYIDKDGNEKTFPVSFSEGMICSPGDYTELTPDSKKISVIYFEDKGMNVVNAGCRFTDCEASLRLVCWANLARINAAYTDANLLKAAIIQTIPKRLANSGYLTKILVLFDGEETKSKDIFSAYTYDEAQDQYLMYPYDYFALNYKIKYSIPMDTDCITEIVLNPKICS